MTLSCAEQTIVRRALTSGLMAAGWTAVVVAGGSFFGGVDFTILGFGIGVGFVLGGTVLLASAMSSSASRGVRAMGAALLGAGAVASANPWFTHDLRLLAFARAAERAKPLVQAIHDFERIHDRPPESLDALVPAQIRAVPTTGLWLSPQFSYESNAPTWYLAVELSMDSFFYDPEQTVTHGGSKRRLGDWVYAFW